MSAVTIQQMADRIAALMEQRLRIRGGDLARKLRKGGRLLPRKVRQAAQELADAAERARNPKLLVQIDMEQVSANYDICLHHLSSVTARGGLGNLLIGVAATVALGLLLAGLVWLFIQRSQGAL